MGFGALGRDVTSDARGWEDVKEQEQQKRNKLSQPEVPASKIWCAKTFMYSS